MSRHQNLTSGNLARIDVVFSEVCANPGELFFLESRGPRVYFHHVFTSLFSDRVTPLYTTHFYTNVVALSTERP